MRIVYLDVDSLRADHTQPYGYGRATTPNLQELSERGVVFDRFYCSDSPCLPSRMAWASGQFGIVNGVVGHFGEAARFRLKAGYPLEPTRPLLGQWLRAHGSYTASVSMFADEPRVRDGYISGGTHGHNGTAPTARFAGKNGRACPRGTPVPH